MLHSIEYKDIHKHRCEICGENACWYDENVELQLGQRGVKVGKNKGLVYATCDKCKKVVCGMPNLRPDHTKIQCSRALLSGHYQHTDCCMLECHYVNHKGNDTFLTLCRDRDCARHFEDDGRQKKIKKAYG